jgi:hypothetical protein
MLEFVIETASEVGLIAPDAGSMTSGLAIVKPATSVVSPLKLWRPEAVMVA